MIFLRNRSDAHHLTDSPFLSPRFSVLQPAVVLVNVLGFFDPLRVLIKNSIATGFIRERNENLITFVDCPPGIDPTSFDWGEAALSAMDGWRVPGPGLFAWRVAP